MQGKDAPLPQATNDMRGQGSREEGSGVDQERAVREAKELYNAGEGRLGTDEAKFTEIIGTRSFAQLRATFEEYNKVCNRLVGVVPGEVGVAHGEVGVFSTVHYL